MAGRLNFKRRRAGARSHSPLDNAALDNAARDAAAQTEAPASAPASAAASAAEINPRLSRSAPDDAVTDRKSGMRYGARSSPPSAPGKAATPARANEATSETKSAAAPRWRRRADERPDEILDAALAVFSAQGFETSRVEDVARAAGISKAGLYLYFPSKEDLLRALINREIAPFARMIAALAEAGRSDPVGTIGGIVAALIGLLADPRRLATPRIVIAVAARFPEIGAHYRAEVVERAIGALAGLVKAGMAQGLFRKVEARAAARLILGPLLMEAIWTNVLGGPPARGGATARARAHLDLVLNGLRPGAHP